MNHSHEPDDQDKTQIAGNSFDANSATLGVAEGTAIYNAAVDATRIEAVFEKAGDEIGPYKLISQIGEGGFGTVWLAERRVPFVQRVALKVIKAGMDSRSVLARFEQERQALAVMSHPNIAKVLDGGMTPSGRPYFAMEYLKAESITEFCDSRKLTVEERLRLFEKVCEAIAHAHLKGIIHRDLKPGNVLAFDMEGEAPSLKVIDFGVAKAVSRGLSSSDVHTEVGQMIGTIDYMSPEQADPSASGIDTRSDVYSLGVMLYEIITGALPFESKDMRSKTYREIQRVLQEDEPPSPSARLSTMATKDRERIGKIEKARGIAVATLVRDLKKELEWIPLKAMRKEPRHRYQGAMSMAEDIRNYLGGKALVAAPESAVYRTKKFVRRHRASVATAVIVTIVLIASSIISTLFGLAEARARALAEQRERDVQRVLEFQQAQLLGIGQEEAGLAMSSEIIRQFSNSLSRSDLSPEAREAALRQFKEAILRVNHTDVAYQLIRGAVLKKGVVIAEADYASEPFIHAGLLMTIGRTYQDLGDEDAARDLFQRAQKIFQTSLGEGDRRTLAARDWAARASLHTPQGEKALEEVKAVLAIRREVFGPDDVDTLESMRALADFEAKAGRMAESATLFEEIIRIATAVKQSEQTLVSDMSRLGELYRLMGLLPESEKIHLEARARVEGITPIPQRLHAYVLTHLGLTQSTMPDARKVASGVEALRAALKIEEAVDGEQHPRSFTGRGNLAVTLSELGLDDAAQAPEFKKESLDLHERSRAIGASLPLAPNAYYLSLSDLAVWNLQHPVGDEAQRKAQLQDAVKLGEEALRALTARDDPNGDEVLTVRVAVASIHHGAGNYSQAESLYKEVLTRRSAYWTPGNKNILDLKSNIARALAAQNRWSESVELLTAAQVDADKERPLESDARWAVANRLLAYLQQWSKIDPASPAAARIPAQELAVEKLRAARQRAGLDVKPRDLLVMR